MKPALTLFLLFVVLISCSKKQENSLVTDLSKNNWYIWLDEKAEWMNDSLFLPPVDISKVPVNQPTCGWEQLYNHKEQITQLPATVEEYFWPYNENQYGISGNYKGVSWFYTTVFVPESSKGKRIALEFESASIRAEIFVNNQLAGYDLIDGTPFQVDISKEVKIGDNNNIAIRITDPCGNFNWRDSRPFTWGNYKIIASHGFGGVTGRVYLHTTDPIFIDDIYIKNNPEPTRVEADIVLNNQTGTPANGELTIEVSELNHPGTIVLTKTRKVELSGGSNQVTEILEVPDAKLWSPESPILYVVHATWQGENTADAKEMNFGFRFFDIASKDGSRYYVLNGKKIVLRTSISWGFWPVNGIFPTPELAKKHVADAKTLGLNMLNFHRAIGNNFVFDEADRQGLLYYEEPGGYRTGVDSFSRQWAREKLLRMVKRDRSRPSLIIYNMQNEIGRDPSDFDKETIRLAHAVDETRCITYTSTNFSKDFYDGACPRDTAPIKMHMVPYNSEILYFGYWDQHNAGGPGCYQDALYNSPDDYLRYTDNKEEIVFWGEEGAIGTVAQLPLIVKSLDATGVDGWDGAHYKNMYKAYDQFLREKGFYNGFKDMQTLITDIGNVALYYQGRIIENIRMNNLVDGYVVNGWESEKIEDHSGIVDEFRNIKGNREILAYYNQPAYIAVKVRNKVIELGDSSLVDFFIINETNILGTCDLKITCTDSSGILLEKNLPVEIAGGNKYGQLLSAGLSIKPVSTGYCKVKTELIQNSKIVATGHDEIFSVSLDFKPGETITYGDDTEGNVAMMLNASGICNIQKVNSDNSLPLEDQRTQMAERAPVGRVYVVGFEPPQKYSRNQSALSDWVMDGNTLIIIKHADKWADYLNQKEVVDYRGNVRIGNVWFGGNHFVREHPLFKDLPVNCAFNWEYQCLAQYKRYRMGLRLVGDECIVGVQCEHKPELFSAVSIIPLGRGHIIISTLDLEGAIRSGEKAAVVAKKILQNYVTYSLNH